MDRNGRTALYSIRGQQDRLLYVGIGFNPLTRWSRHSKRDWWQEVVRVDVEWFGTRAEAEAAEKARIRQFRPVHNVVHNRRRVVVKKPVQQAKWPAVLEAMRERIRAGEFTEAVPQQKALIAQYGASFHVIGRVLYLLEQEGLIERAGERRPYRVTIAA